MGGVALQDGDDTRRELDPAARRVQDDVTDYRVNRDFVLALVLLDACP
jgi:hypothetical protein